MFFNWACSLTTFLFFHEGEMSQTAEFHLLRGKALNVQQTFDQSAMDR